MKIVSVVGARPQFIKAAVVSREIRSTAGMHEVLVHTGQHYDENMSEIFFRELEIPEADYSLGVGSGPHGAQTGRMLEAIERVLVALEPDCLIVYGDTNSTLAGALAAVKLHIPVAHVEAGLRSFNRRMPEETNRVLTDHVSDLLFTPTSAAFENLKREGISCDRLHTVGDVMYDASLYYGVKADRESHILEDLQLKPGGYVLSTIHRAENTDNSCRFRTIVEGLALVAEEIPVVVPLHPRTRDVLRRTGLDETSGLLTIIEPVGYLDMVMLERHSRLIVTDSGGVQKEAFFHNVPCVTLRDETEWIELVELGWNRVVPPTSPSVIVEGVQAMLDHSGEPAAVYGDGDAARKITNVIQATWADTRLLILPR